MVQEVPSKEESAKSDEIICLIPYRLFINYFKVKCFFLVDKNRIMRILVLYI